MTRESTRPPEEVEPRLDPVRVYDVRQADSDVNGLVEKVLSLLDNGSHLVDLSRHDSRGTTIELRAQPTTGAPR